MAFIERKNKHFPSFHSLFDALQLFTLPFYQNGSFQLIIVFIMLINMLVNSQSSPYLLHKHHLSQMFYTPFP